VILFNDIQSPSKAHNTDMFMGFFLIDPMLRTTSSPRYVNSLQSKKRVTAMRTLIEPYWFALLHDTKEVRSLITQPVIL
jgi:hypothetical protein